MDFSEVWISRQEFTPTRHTSVVLTQDCVESKHQQSSDSRLLVMWVVRANSAGKMSVSRSGSIDQSEASIGESLANERQGNVGNNAGVKRLLALVPADVALLLVASSSSYKIILILSIWKWFKWVYSGIVNIWFGLRERREWKMSFILFSNLEYKLIWWESLFGTY